MARWEADPQTGAADALLMGYCLGLVALREGETAYAWPPVDAVPFVTQALAGARPLPRVLADAGLRTEALTVLTAETSGMQRHPSLQPALEARLREAAATPSSVRLLPEVVSAILNGVAGGDGIPGGGKAGRPGFTADFSAVTEGVCAFGRSTENGEPVGEIVIVRLPEPLDSVWGETAAVLLAHLYARKESEGVVFTDCAGIISRLRDFGKLRKYALPPLISTILGHPGLRTEKGIDAVWVRRSTTAAQAAVNQVARQASSASDAVAPGVRELSFLELLERP